MKQLIRIIYCLIFLLIVASKYSFAQVQVVSINGSTTTILSNLGGERVKHTFQLPFNKDVNPNFFGTQGFISYNIDDSSIYYNTGNQWIKLAAGGISNPMTTTGDIIYSADNSGTPARLGVSIASFVLGTLGGIPTWVNAVLNITSPDTSIGINPSAGTYALSVKTAPVSFTHHVFSVGTGATINLINKQYNIITTSGGTLTALTLNLPGSPNNNDAITIKFTQNVGTTTWTGGTYISAISSASVSQLVTIVFDSGTGFWY